MDRFDWLELSKVPKEAQSGRLPGKPPHDGPSFYTAARRMREAGHFRAATAYYQRAVGFDDHNYQARAEWIDTLIRANHLQEAAACATEALDTFRQVRPFYAARALTLAHTGQAALAYPLSDVSLEGEPSWYACVVRAEVLLKDSLQNRDEALRFLERALEIAHGKWEPYFVAGIILLDAGWPTLAAAHLAEAVHIKPGAAAGLLCLGDCFRDLGLYDQALFYYQKILDTTPKHEAALERQRACAPRLFGLMRPFRTEDLRKRWNAQFEANSKHWEPTTDDF